MGWRTVHFQYVHAGRGALVSIAAAAEKRQALLELKKKAAAHIQKKGPTEIAAAQKERDERRQIDRIFPTDGPFRRELYPKHMRFFTAGRTYRLRLLLGGNKTGKTKGVAAEISYHLTGEYPKWWKGFRFHKPINAWMVNKTWKDVRDINQAELCGPIGRIDRQGTGMIPGDRIIKT